MGIIKKNISKQKNSDSSPELGQSFFIARQAIFDLQMNVFAYELLFRNSVVNEAKVNDANQATSTLIINSFVDLGLENITNNKLAFINLTRDYFIGKIPVPFPCNKVVLEVLEDIQADEETLAGLTALVKQGFAIALDDFILSDSNRELIPLADIIKLDILAMNESELREQVAALQPYGKKLLAEKVESLEQYILCKELGFDYFQGYFFCKPKMIEGKNLPVNNIAILEIIAKLQNEDCDFGELEELISNDLSLSYKLLKIMNSPFYNQVSKVNSIEQALILIGIDALKNWVTVLSLTMIENKPVELVKLSLIRAKMCESLAAHFRCNKQSAYTVGLFSLLDVLMDQSKQELIGDLPLADEILEALLRSKGKLGALLALVIFYEGGNWDKLPDNVPLPDNMKNLYITAVSWADELIGV